MDTKKIKHHKGIIIIYKSFLHEGIIGIIASKVKDYFNKPCIVLTNTGNIIKGSARSISDFNLGTCINEAVHKKILLTGGGHNLAAGLSLKKKNIEYFKKFINNFYKVKKNSFKQSYVNKISLNAINNDFIKNIDLLGPYGNKNPNTLFILQNIRIIKSKKIMNNFFTCFVSNNKKIMKATLFQNINSDISYQLQNSNNAFDVIAKIKQNKWNNKNTLEIEIIDLIKVI